MKIQIKEVLKNKEIIGYNADFTELAGSPAIGSGRTKEEAVTTLFIRNIKIIHLPAVLDFNYLEINGEPYQDYQKQSK